MAKTVADLMNELRGYSGVGEIAERLVGSSFGTKPVEEAREPRLMVVSLVMDPAEVQIVDGRLVYRKEVIATGRREAMERLGIEVK